MCTVIFVTFLKTPKTHNVGLVAPIADCVISMSPDGRILSQGSLSDALAKDERLSTELKRDTRDVEHDSAETKNSPDDKEKKSPDGKLVMSEEVSEGHVERKSCRSLFLPF